LSPECVAPLMGVAVGQTGHEEIGRPLFIDPRRRPAANPLPASVPSAVSQSLPLRAATTHGLRVFFSPCYIQHRFHLHFGFPVFVFRPRAPQHGHFILPAGREKYAYSGDGGGGDHYYIGIGNGGGGSDGGGGCGNNIVIITI